MHTWWRTIRPWRTLALTALVATSVALPGGSVAAQTADPHTSVPSALPKLRAVADWVDEGLKLQAASSGVRAQLRDDGYAWFPNNSCLNAAGSSTDAKPCVLGDTSSPTTLVLYGDSSAEEWALDADALGRADHFRVVVYVHSECPVGDIDVKLQNQSPDKDCPVFRSDVLAKLASMHPAPALVVVSELRLEGYETLSGKNVTNAAWSSALADTLRQIDSDGLAVASLHGVPVDGIDPSQCIAANLNKLAACEIKVSREDVGGWDGATRDGALTAHAASINLHPLFCGTSACPVVVDGAITHSGENHVTERYSKDVLDAVAELLGCIASQTFTNDAVAAPILADLNGATPSNAFLKACAGLQT